MNQCKFTFFRAITETLLVYCLHKLYTTWYLYYLSVLYCTTLYCGVLHIILKHNVLSFQLHSYYHAVRVSVPVSVFDCLVSVSDFFVSVYIGPSARKGLWLK